MNSLTLTPGLVAALFLSGTAAAAEEPGCAAAVPPVQKLTIYNQSTPTVYYYTTSDSPRLQALCRTLQWAENEVALVEELQRLKLDYVRNERRLAASYMASPLNPAALPGYPSYPRPESALSYSLAGVLADEATPERALQLILLLEQAQTDLAEELKRMAPKDRAGLEGDAKALAKAIALLRSKRGATPANRPALPPRAVPAAVYWPTVPPCAFNASGSVSLRRP
jgi:hypothetical protein